MKFDLSDFVQLDTKGLLAVNGGSDCGGGPTGPTSNATDPTSGGSGGPGSSTTTESSKNGFYNTKGKTVDQIPSGGRLITRNGETKKTYTYDNPNGKGTNTVTYAQNKDGSWTVVSNYYYNCTGSSYGSSSTGGSGGGSCGDYSSSSTKSGTGSTDKTNGGTGSTTTTSTGTGTCGGTGTKTSDGGTTTPTIPASGNFGQITDGSYADKLTMQYYLKHFPWTGGEIVDSFMYGTYVDHNGVEQQCKFSTVGCKEIGSAKIGSELLGENVSPMSIQNNCDLDKDGNLSMNEIAKGLNDMLDEKFGDIFDIECEEINSNINLAKLEEIANKNDTYVLGFAQNCHGGHWIVLEGYSQDSLGNIIFNYDGTSDNDMVNNRCFVLGMQNQSVSSEKYAITRLQTFTKVIK